MKKLSHYLPHILGAGLVILMIWSGINPVERATWWAEIIPVTAIFLLFATTLKRFRFSNTAYVLAAVWLYMHTIGSHFTFEKVPFDCVTDFFGFERNHYDRVAHFAIGFYAFPIAELIKRTKFVTKNSAIILFSLLAIISVAASYELIEWWYADFFGGDQASDFLGSQGDTWDAQKDILADTLGAICALFIFEKQKF